MEMEEKEVVPNYNVENVQLAPWKTSPSLLFHKAITVISF